MQKFYTAFVVAAFALSLSAPVFAQTNDTGTTSDTGSQNQATTSNDQTGSSTTTGTSTSNGAAGTGTVSILVMKHVCPGTITSSNVFNGLGGFISKEKACPTAVLPTDTGAPGAIGGSNGQPFAFTVTYQGQNGNSMAKTAPDGFIQDKMCETDVNMDLNGDGTISANTCLDASFYAYDGIPRGQVTVSETTPINGTHAGVLEFTPSSIVPNNDADTFVSVQGAGSVLLDTSRASGTDVMLHIFNFQNGSSSTGTSTATSTTGTTTPGGNTGTSTGTTTPGTGTGTSTMGTTTPTGTSTGTTTTPMTQAELLDRIASTLRQISILVNQLADTLSRTSSIQQ